MPLASTLLASLILLGSASAPPPATAMDDAWAARLPKG